MFNPSKKLKGGTYDINQLKSLYQYITPSQAVNNLQNINDSIIGMSSISAQDISLLKGQNTDILNIESALNAEFQNLYSFQSNIVSNLQGYISTSGLDILNTEGQNDYDAEQVSINKSSLIGISSLIIADNASLPGLEYIRASTLASYQAKSVVEAKLLSSYNGLSAIMSTLEHDYISTLIQHNYLSTMIAMSIASAYSSLSDLMLESTIANISDLYITSELLPDFYTQASAIGSQIDYRNNLICTLKSTTIPQNIADLSTISDITASLSSQIAYSTLVIEQTNSSIKGLSTIIEQYKSTQAFYSRLNYSSLAQIGILEQIYSENMYQQSLAIANYTYSSTFVAMNSTQTMLKIVNSLILEQAAGDNVNDEVSTLVNTSLGHPGTGADLATLYLTLSTLFSIQQAAYNTASDALNTLLPQSGGGVTDIADVYDGLIGNLTDTYNTLITQRRDTTIEKTELMLSYNSLLQTAILSTNIWAQMDRDMIVYNSEVADYNRQISQETQVVASLTNQKTTITSMYSEYNAYVQAYQENQIAVQTKITNNINAIADATLLANDYATVLANISSGNFNGLMSLAGPLQIMYQNAVAFNQYSEDVAESLSSLYGYDYLNMTGMLYVISTQLAVDVAMKDMQNATDNIEVLTTTGSLNTNITDEISSISTKRYILDEFFPLFNQLYTYISSEYLNKIAYKSTRRVYEQQSYYKIVPPSTINSVTVLSSDDFQKIEYIYDLLIQQTNLIIDTKKIYVSSIFQPKLEYILSNVIDPAQLLYLNSPVSYQDVNNTEYIVSSILPFSVSYIYVPIRTDLFLSGGIIPTTTVDVCVSTFNETSTLNALNSPDVILRSTTFISPTTTIDTRSCGVKGRYIQISKVDNDLEIMQIIVIDKTGKNVAFGKKSTILPTLLQRIHMVDLNYITNGNYSRQAFMSMVESMNSHFYTRYMFISPSVEGTNVPYSKVVTIDLGETYDITAIQYLKFMNEYTSTGIKISIADESRHIVGSQSLTLNTEKELLDFTDDSQMQCPLDIVPLRSGTCGVLARFVRIYPSVPPTTTIPATTTIGPKNIIQITYYSPAINYIPSFSKDSITTGKIWNSNTVTIQNNNITGLFTNFDTNGRFKNNTGYDAQINFNMYWQSSNTGWGLTFKVYYSNDTLKNTYTSPVQNPQTINQHITLLNNEYFTVSWSTITYENGTHTDTPLQITITIESSPLLSIIPTTTAPPTTTATPPYRFIFTQLVVIDSSRNNIASNKMVRFFESGSAQPIQVPNSLTSSNIYQALPIASCYSSPIITDNNTYLEIDLGDEFDITALHIYNTSDGNSYQKGLSIKLYTEDKLLATETQTLTNNRKEIVPFIGFNVDSNCSMELQWPSYYGVAGLITRYVRLIQTQPGGFGFSKIEIIDKNGRDIGLFKPVTATSNQSRAYLGVSNRQSAVSYTDCYVATATTTIQSYIIDLQWEHEICAINIYGCTDIPNLTNNINIDLFRQLGTSLATRSLQGSQQIEFFDFRYNPEDSIYPTQVIPAASVIAYGLFGTMCDTIRIPFIVPLSDTNATVVESTGRNLFVPANVSYNSGNTIVSFGYMADITSVTATLDPTKLSVVIELIDCHGNQVANESIRRLPTNNQIMYADFRNPSLNAYAPLQPLSIRNGPNNKGIMAQYIRIIPRDTTTPLYISQIIAVNSNGDNVTFESDTFTIDSRVIANATYIVDGNYEAKLTDADWLNLYFTKYRQKLATQSFVSNAGTQEQNFLLIDLGVAHELNSIIYICTQGYNKEAKGVIVQLIDSNLNVVGIQLVSQLAISFGVDILDFRIDRTESYLNPNAGLEIKQRNPTVGKTGCGTLVKYIRIKQITGSQPIQLSQIVAIDSYGFNVALYKPTFATSNNMRSHTIVDGSYYKRPIEQAYISNPNPDEYIEINLTAELEIVNVYAINILADPNDNFSNLQIILYNKERDIIMTQHIPVDLTDGFATNDDNPAVISFNNYPQITKIGVSIQSLLMSIKSDIGLASAYANAGQSVPDIPIQQNLVSNTECATDLSPNARFTRGPNNGIPTTRIRIYNPGQYIQISQIMAFTANGINVALRKPCMATSVLPGLYVSRITDGQEGYFHSPRSESECYISGLKRYTYVDIDLQGIYEIVGVKYVPPNTNYYRNIGLTIQLLSADDVFLAQYAITPSTANGVLIDFRFPIGTPTSIAQIVMPSIYTLSAPAITTPNGLAEDSAGNIYYTNTYSGSIINTSSGAIIVNTLKYPAGLACDGTNLYVADYGNGVIKKIVVATSMVYTVPLTGITKPYAVYYNSGMLYCSEYKMGGRIFIYNTVTNTFTILTQTFNYPASIIMDINSLLYIASAYDKIIYTVASTMEPHIGLNLPVSIAFSSPCALAYDASSNMLFIADYAQDKIYSVDKINTVNIIAGTGTAGYSGDGAQGNKATINKPVCLYYSRQKGYLYVSDYQNNVIRYIDFNSGPPAPVQSTTTYQPPSYYTTTTLTQPDITLTPETTITTTNPANTYTILTEPASIQNTYTSTSTITSIVYYNNNIYFTSNYKLYSYNIQTKNTTTVIGRGFPGILMFGYFNGDYYSNNSGYFLGDYRALNNDWASPVFGTITCMVVNNNILYMCDTDYCIVYAYNLGTATFTKFLGSYPNTGWGYGDGKSPLETSLLNPTFIGFDNNGIFYISDSGNYCIRRINATNKVQTVAGTGSRIGGTLYTANVQSTAISLTNPLGFIFDKANNLIFCDNNAIYTVNNEMRMSLLCGPSVTPSTPINILQNSVSALSVSLNKPYGITIDNNGVIYVSSYNTHQILKIVKDPLYLTYSVSIYAGLGTTSTGGFNSSDIYSQYATLKNPSIIQVLPDSSLYFIDSSIMIRYILPETYDTYNMGLEGMLNYSALSIIANNSQNLYNTSAITGGEESKSILNRFVSTSICVDLIGNIYICNTARNNILKIDTTGKVVAFVTGLSGPKGICIYNNSILYISNNDTNSIISVPINNPSSVTTVLSNINDPQLNAVYNMGYLFTVHPNPKQITVYYIKASTNPTTTIIFNTPPFAIAVDSTGSVYVSFGDIINKYAVTYSGSTVTFSSTPLTFTSGLGMCSGITYYNSTLYYSSSSLRVVYSKKSNDTDGAMGIIVAGTINISTVPVNGSYANTTGLYRPLNVSVDSNGTIYILDAKPTIDSTIYKIPAYNFLMNNIGYIITGSTISSTAPPTNILAPLAKYGDIRGTCFGPDGSIYISDYLNHYIWKMNTAGYVSIYAGTGVAGSTALGIQATSAKLNQPAGIIMSSDGILYICETGNNRVTKVLSDSNIISHVAGTGAAGSSILNSAVAISSAITGPTSIALDIYNNIYVSANSGQIYIINSLGIISTYIGGGTAIPANGLLPLTVALSQPGQLALNSSNELHFINTGRHQVFKLSATGTISLVAGTGTVGYSPDGTTATLALLSSPKGLAIDTNDTIYISDNGNNRIRTISGTPGQIKTIAGSGEISSVAGITAELNINGSGQIPTQMVISQPGHLAIDKNNRLLITQIGVPQLSMIPFTNSNSCGLLCRYIRVEGQGLGKYINILRIIVYNITGTMMSQLTISALTNVSNAQNILQSTNTIPYISATTGLNEYILIDLGADTIVSFINIISQSVDAIGMRFMLLNSQHNIVNETITNPNIVSSIGQYLVFRSIYALNQCTIPENLPIIYRNIYYGVPNVRYVKIRGNGSPVTIEISQIAVINGVGLNVVLGGTVTAFSNTSTGLNMVDGFFASKSLTYESNTSASEYVKLDLGSNTDVVFIFLYLGLDNKTNNNGLLLELLDSTGTILETRLLQNIINVPSMQYVSLDFRTLNIISSSNLTFTNISQNYMLQENANIAPTITYRTQTIRYVRIYASPSLGFSQIVMRSAKNGSNIAYGATINAVFSSSDVINPSNFDLQLLLTNRFNNAIQFYISATSATSSYIQVDLGIDYNISDICIYTLGPQVNTTFTIETYKYNGTLLTNPAPPPTPPTSIISTENQFPTIYTYYVKPQLGTQNVRYIKYVNVGTNPIQISELIVIDKNGINVAYNKIVTSLTGTATAITDGTNSVKTSAYTSTSSNSNEYVQIDLGGEYEIVLVKFWNAGTNKNYAAGSFIRLYNSLQVQQASYTLVGGTDSETADFRYSGTGPGTGPFTSLRYAESALTDPFLTGTIRARYIRIENPGLLLLGSTPSANEPTVLFSQVAVYDIFGVNIAVGKPTRAAVSQSSSIYLPVNNSLSFLDNYNTNSTPGDWWEVDLGDNYSISKVQIYGPSSTFSVSNIPVIFYNNYREEVRRVFINITDSNITSIIGMSLPVLKTMPAAPTTRSGMAVRFIRIENTNYNNGSPNAPTGTGAQIVIRQLVAIDARGINVAVGKATRNSNIGAQQVSQSYGAVNGTFNNTYRSTETTNEWWEVDLGDTYDIKTIIYYNDVGTPLTSNMTMYLLDSYRYIQGYNTITANASTLKQTFNYPSTSTSSLALVQNYGVKTRYVILQKSISFILSQIAIIDCLGRNVALGKSVSSPSAINSSSIINGTLSASSGNYSTIYSIDGVATITIDLGQEYYIINVIGYSFPRINSINNQINESGDYPFNTTLAGTTVILQNAYRVETGRKIFTTECCSNNVSRYVSSTLSSTSFAPPFGNTTQYCPNRMTSRGSYIANSGTDNTASINSKCQSCPTGTTYDGVNSCLSCPSGYTYDTVQATCLENNRLMEIQLKSDNGATFNNEFLKSQQTKQFAVTKNIVNTVSDWSTPLGLLYNIFYTNSSPRTIQNVSSSFLRYAGNWIINTWTFTFNDSKLTIPNSTGTYANNTNTAQMWDTDPRGRELQTTNSTIITTRNTTEPIFVTDKTTIIPSQYRETNYYQMLYDTPLAQYYYTDIPMNSYDATYCETLDFTGYTVPPLPARRQQVITSLTPAQTQSYLGGASWVTPQVTTPNPYTLDTGATTILMTEDGYSGIASSGIKVPTTLTTTTKTYNFSYVGTYKFSGPSAMGADPGRFGLSYTDGRGGGVGSLPSDGSYTYNNSTHYFIDPNNNISDYNLINWWSYNASQLTYKNGYNINLQYLCPWWADSLRTIGGWNGYGIGPVDMYNLNKLDFSKVDSPASPASYSNMAKFYYYMYSKTFGNGTGAQINTNYPYIEFSKNNLDGSIGIINKIKILNMYGRTASNMIPTMCIVMVGQVSNHVLKIPVYSNGWFWDEIANSTYNGAPKDPTNGLKVNGSVNDSLIRYKGPYSMTSTSNVLRLPILSEFINLYPAGGALHLGEQYKLYYVDEPANDSNSYGNLYDSSYMIDKNSSATTGISYTIT